MSSKKRECIPEVHPFSRISVEKANLETLPDAAVYLVEDVPIKRGGGVEVVFKKKSGKFVTLQLREDGTVFMSEEYGMFGSSRNDLVKCHFLLLPRVEINQRERHIETCIA